MAATAERCVFGVRPVRSLQGVDRPVEGASLRILYVAIDPPCPPITGARQRTYLQLKALRELGETAVILVSGHAVTPEEREQTERAFGRTMVMKPETPGMAMPWRLGRWVKPSLVDRVAQALDYRPLSLTPCPKVVEETAQFAEAFRPDVSMTRYYMAGRPAETWRFGRAILDLDDVDTEYLRNLLKDPATEAWRRVVIAMRLRTLEGTFRRDLERYKAVTLASAADLKHVSGLDATALPNIPFTNEGMGQPALEPARGSKQVLVVATWGYMPNILGLNRFLERVWGQVRAAVPEATLNVVGMNMRAQEREAWGKVPGVVLTGFTKDLGAEYAKAACCIAPVYQGGGTKIKVLEALSFGRAVVVTEHAHHGYEDTLPSPSALIRAESDEQMAAGCVRLLKDPNERDRVAMEGYTRVREHFSFSAVRDRLHEVVRRVMAR